MRKLMKMLVVVIVAMSFLTGCGEANDTLPEGSYRLLIDGVDEAYYVTFTGKNRTAYVEYPDGTIETSELVLHHKSGRISFVLNGSRDEWKYDRKKNELVNVSATARLIKTADRNPEGNNGDE